MSPEGVQPAGPLPLLQSLACLLMIPWIARVWLERERQIQLQQEAAAASAPLRPPHSGAASVPQHCPVHMQARPGRGTSWCWAQALVLAQGQLSCAARPAARGAAMTVRRTLSMVPRSPGCPPLVQVMAGLVGGVIQLMVILTKNNLDDLIQSPLGAASPCLAVLVLLVSGMLVPLLAPRWFERHRTPLFAASRLLYFSLPTAPSPHGYSYILQVRCSNPGCILHVTYGVPFCRGSVGWTRIIRSRAAVAVPAPGRGCPGGGALSCCGF